MSIEFSPSFDSRRSSLASLRGPGKSKRLSPRRLAANRRNAQRSTGPRTVAGKKRASRNAIKHGLCSKHDACLEGECAATYATFVAEIEAELQPRTALQYALVPHIANLLWRIDRLPKAQADIFELELEKCAAGEELSASQVLARRFSDDPTRNGFLLIGRYERGLHNQLLRLMSRFDALAKRRATTTTPWPADEPPVPDEGHKPAWTGQQMAQQQAAFARREAAIDRGEPPADEYESNIDHCIRLCREQKRTQSNPPENRSGASETAKCAKNNAAPVTKRTHGDSNGGVEVP
jgi:hypothetical protein